MIDDYYYLNMFTICSHILLTSPYQLPDMVVGMVYIKYILYDNFWIACYSLSVEKAEQRRKDAEKAKVQLTNEDDMTDPLESASYKRFCKLLDIIFDHEDDMVPENFKLGEYSFITVTIWITGRERELLSSNTC